MPEIIKNWDISLFLFFNGLNAPFFDDLMWWVSGKLNWLPLYILIIGYIIWKFRKKSVWIILALIVLITLTDQVSVNFFKNVFHRLRPCHNPEISHLVHLVNGYCGGMYGFVS